MKFQHQFLDCWRPLQPWPAPGMTAMVRVVGCARLAAGVCLGLLLAGCSSQPSPSAGQTPGASSAPRAAAAAGMAADAPDGSGTVWANKSVFTAGGNAGRDPFFGFTAPPAGTNSEVAPAPQLPLFSYLKLMGIRPGTSRPMALINRTPLAPGEERDVSIVISNQFSQLEVQKVNVRCLEVRRDSVLISIAGEQGVRELRMAQAK